MKTKLLLELPDAVSEMVCCMLTGVFIFSVLSFCWILLYFIKNLLVLIETVKVRMAHSLPTPEKDEEKRKDKMEYGVQKREAKGKCNTRGLLAPNLASVFWWQGEETVCLFQYL